MKPVRLALALVVFACLLPSASASAGPDAKALRPFVAKNKLYALWIPAQWTVHDEARDDSFRVLAESPDRASAVEFYWQRRDQGRANMLQLLGQYRAVLWRRHADAVFSEVRTSADGARAAIGVQYQAGRRSIRGKIYFEAGAAGFSVQGYFAPAERLPAERPLLLNVMASFAFAKNRGGGQAPAPAQVPVDLPLAQRRAPDGSLSIATPADWNFLAGGGKVVTGAPNGSMGIIFTTFQGNPMLPQASIAQGVIGSTYRPPAQTLATILEGGKVYETDSHGTRDTATGDYYEGRGYNWVNFEGQSPNHPSETMREISSAELREINGRR